ncbi:unnamed protein product (macronuclear) [Paramecium tetraurelia]|uniref:HTH myb-type domain-containing protein n=1 Tax=Paramecium tetraurelia TaxID=5888 RepID=A0CG10_PARTE|nr:uncharacterized protein GSPATT00038170001 [Paramecium tetraurelia]CAK69727.1 unnamed protein product [Paramecium tetraurelia]|eukprot:XP_001437124.1 hypothetical protein (macronuclear) [Paramecium tetraurelia strain d4-2]
MKECINFDQYEHKTQNLIQNCNQLKQQKAVMIKENEEIDSQNEQPNKAGLLKKQKKKNEYDYHRKKRRCADGTNSKKSGKKFSLEDDKRILQLVLNNGPKFQRIHRHFHGKTLAMVKNRYYKYLRFRWEILGQQYLINLEITNIQVFPKNNKRPYVNNKITQGACRAPKKMIFSLKQHSELHYFRMLECLQNFQLNNYYDYWFYTNLILNFLQTHQQYTFITQ